MGGVVQKPEMACNCCSHNLMLKPSLDVTYVVYLQMMKYHHAKKKKCSRRTKKLLHPLIAMLLSGIYWYEISFILLNFNVL